MFNGENSLKGIVGMLDLIYENKDFKPSTTGLRAKVTLGELAICLHTDITDERVTPAAVEGPNVEQQAKEEKL